MADFCMPSLGADMQEGTLVEWLVKPGDRVKRRDVVAVVETDKAAIEIEVYEDGVVERLVVEPGQKVPVGTVLAVIRRAGAAAAGTGSGPGHPGGRGRGRRRPRGPVGGAATTVCRRGGPGAGHGNAASRGSATGQRFPGRHAPGHRRRHGPL